MAEKLNQSLIKKLAVPAGKREVIVWDSEVKGLGVRVTASGTKSYILKLRIGKGRDAPIRKPRIGAVEDMTPDKARTIARDWKQLALAGIDPTQALREQEEDPRPTMDFLCDEYLDKHAVTKRSGDADQKKIDRHIRGRLGRKAVEDVTHNDILVLHRGMSDTPVEANRTLALLSKLFSVAINHGMRADNPTRGVSKYPEKSRDRVLSDDEISWFWEACEGLGYPIGTFGQVVLLTGQRLNEIAQMKWSEIDDDGVFTIPPERVKNKREHKVPLSPLVRALLSRVERKGDFVFSKNGMVPMNGWAKDVNKLRTAMEDAAGREIPRWTWHDLRRTAATGMARLAIPIPVTEAVLNHVSGSQAGIVGIYQRHDYAGEKQRALEAWANMVVSIVEDEEPNVVKLEVM